MDCFNVEYLCEYMDFIDNIIIENFNCQKILGVYVQNNLKWEAQYIHIYKQLTTDEQLQ